MRYFFHTAFLGQHYHGWQRQSNSFTVQEVVEQALSKLLKEPISAMGCGRTDAQVNASQFFFHVDVMKEWDDRLFFPLNKTLPEDIAIFEILPMKDNQHARFDAIQRRYDYYIHTHKDPFLSSISSWYPGKNFNIDNMKKAVLLLPKYQDYRAFCKSPDIYLHTRCRISSANLFSNAGGDKLRFCITADRFLGRMVRLIVGKLILIGKGEMSVDEFENLLITGQQPKFFDAAHPQGLFLSKIVYPYLELPTRTEFTLHRDTEEEWLSL